MARWRKTGRENGRPHWRGAGGRAWAGGKESGRDAFDGRQIEPNATAFDLDGKLAGAALIGGHRTTGIQLDVPVVHRAGDLPAMHDPLRQRTALVRAAVLQREDFIVGGTEHGNIQTAVA